jgi:hypothetical protein
MVGTGDVRGLSHGRPAASSRSTSALIAAGIVATFVVICCVLAWMLNVWQDETYTLHTTGASFGTAVHQAIYFEAQAPLYFLVLWVWRTLNHSAFEARLLSIVFVAVALLLARRFALRYLPATNANIVMAAIALNPFTIFAAVETRVYGAVVLLSVVLLGQFFRGFVDRSASRSARVWFFAVAVLAIYTQYYVGAVLPAGAVIVALANRRALPAYLIGCVASAVALLPLAKILPLQMQAYGAADFASPEPFYFAVVAPLGFLFPHGSIGTWHVTATNAAYALLVVAPLTVALTAWRKLQRNTAVLVGIVALICGFFALVIGVAHQSVLIPRHTAVLLIPTLLAAFGVWQSIESRRRTPIAIAFLATYTALSGFGVAHEYRGLSKNGDWQRVATYLRGAIAPGDPIAVFDAEAQLPLGYYLGNATPVVAIPRPMSFAQFDETAFVLHGESDVAASLGRMSAVHGHVWLVKNDACDKRARFYGCAYLDAYVAERYRVVRTQTFRGSSVLELELRGT